MPTQMLRLLIATAAALTAVTTARAIEFDDIDIPYEEFTLDNGLRVIVHTDRKAPIVSMITWYHVGSKDEPEGRTGFAHLFEHLMFQGSENHDEDYFGPLSEVGATGINGTTTFDRTAYFQTVPTGALERMLWLESDRMTHLLGAVDQATLDEQRSVVQNEKRQAENRPWGSVWDVAFRGLFSPGHPYQHPVIGSMEDLDAATLADVKDWFDTYYGASNVVIALAGDIDVATARPLIEKYYADAPAGQPLSRIARWVPQLTEKPPRGALRSGRQRLHTALLGDSVHVPRIGGFRAVEQRILQGPHGAALPGPGRGASPGVLRTGLAHRL